MSKYTHGRHSRKRLLPHTPYLIFPDVEPFLTSLPEEGNIFSSSHEYPTKLKSLRLASWPQIYLFSFINHLAVPLKSQTFHKNYFKVSLVKEQTGNMFTFFQTKIISVIWHFIKLVSWDLFKLLNKTKSYFLRKRNLFPPKRNCIQYPNLQNNVTCAPDSQSMRIFLQQRGYSSFDWTCEKFD